MSASTLVLGSVLASFFNDHLKIQKGLRPNSITSYADALRLFLQFAAKAGEKRITELGLDDLDANTVSSFLNSLEENRRNAVQSRNQRLAALRTFFEYVARRFPERLGQAQEVAMIPRKRAQPPETVYLERDEIESTLAALPAEGRRALRDRTLLVFLYNTGARVQEAADLRVSDVHFDPTPRVHLHGKGNKWRVCPLWDETAALIKRLVAEQVSAPDRPIFVGAKEAALTRFGIYKIIRRYTKQDCQTAIRWPVEGHLTSHLAAQHGGASSGSRRRGECYSRLAWPRELGDNESLRGNYDPHQAGCLGKVHGAWNHRREDSAKASLAKRCLPAGLAPIVVALCCRKLADPP
jgi:site-specific recombinase XerD